MKTWNGSSQLANTLFGERYGIDWEYISKENTDIFVNGRIIKIGDLINKRYFFACSVGNSHNGSLVFNNFDIKDYKYPSLKQCIEVSNEKFPNLSNVMLVSITELSKSDYAVFASAS